MSFFSHLFDHIFEDGGSSGGFALGFIAQGPGGISSLGTQFLSFSIAETLASQNNFTFDFSGMLNDLPVEQDTPGGPIMREYHPSDTVPDVLDLPPSQNIHIPAPWIDEHGHLTKNVSFDASDQLNPGWLSDYFAASGYDWA